ncbi:MAG TPA: hypothetical protein VEH49_00570 [Methylomirabilota bacterium]|nr:hypothetical protein [Methylomirabilota bacterium]
MRTSSMKRIFSTAVLPMGVGAALRLLFVLRFPAATGDTLIYEQLAENWLRHGVYGLIVAGKVTPVDMRLPGYSGYLAVVYWVSGHTAAAARIWVMLGQAAVDLGTAALAARMVGFLLPESRERNLFQTTAFWLACTCPFVANYAAVPLTEVFATFFTAATLCCFVLHLRRAEAPDLRTGANPVPLRAGGEGFVILGGLCAGIGTLFRPETPLLLLAAGPALAFCYRRAGLTRRLILSLVAAGISCAAPLLPWTARNAVTLHEFQPLAPRYAELPGEVATRGFIAWEKTWLWRLRDVYLVSWKMNSEAIDISDIPASAFDTDDERERVTTLLDDYNDTTELTAEQDEQFAKLARERTARHPFRTYLAVPLARAATMWFAPRLELLPYSGKLLPVGERISDDPTDFAVTLGFSILNILYLALAAWGAVRLWRMDRAAQPGVLLLAGYVLLRTAFFTTVETPEPRYMLECFPALLALAAYAFSRKAQAP